MFDIGYYIDLFLYLTNIRDDLLRSVWLDDQFCYEYLLKLNTVIDDICNIINLLV